MEDKFDGSVTITTSPNEPTGTGKSKDIEQEFIDGDARAWFIVAGAWLNLFATLGNIYSFGVYQDFYTRKYLSHHSPSSISWIGSLQLTIPFSLGVVAGKFFDKGYVRSLIITGSIVFVFSIFMLSLTREGKYYQIFLSQGLGMGLGAGFVFPPSVTAVTVHFRRRRILAVGIALTGISLGALAIPITLNHLLPVIGFGPAVRVTGYIALGCLVAGNCLICPRQMIKKGDIPAPNMLSFFRDPPYVCFLIATVISLLVVYFPVFYLQLFSVEHHIDKTLSFYSLAILNGAGVIGRLGANHMGDLYGVWNIQVPITLITSATVWAILGVRSRVSLIIVSFVYGVFSSAWLSLTMAALATLSPSPQETGARVGVGFGMASLGLLGSAPIQGALLGSQQADFVWIRPIAFCGSLLLIGTVMYGIVRTLVAKRKGSQRV